MEYDNLERQVGIVFADIEANCKQHGIRGILEHSDIERMVAEYDEADKQARVHGKFQHLTGLIYKSFSRKVHVIKPFPINKKDYTVYERVDTHPRNPDAIGWYAVNKWGQKFVIDEFYEEVQGTRELGYQIKKRADQYRIEDRKIDPSAFNNDQHKFNQGTQGKSLARELEELGLFYEPASKQRTKAIRRTQQALLYQEKDGLMVELPELFVFNTCIRHIWEFEHWQWTEWSGKSAEFKDKSEKPQDKNDHQMENLGRFLIDDPIFTTYVPEYIKEGYSGVDYSPLASSRNEERSGIDTLDPFE